jgi:hypothetical protein
LPGLVLNCDCPYLFLCLPSSWDYRRKHLCPASFPMLKGSFQKQVKLFLLYIKWMHVFFSLGFVCLFVCFRDTVDWTQDLSRATGPFAFCLFFRKGLLLTLPRLGLS